MRSPMIPTILLFIACSTCGDTLSAQHKLSISGIWTDAKAYGSDTYGETYRLRHDSTFEYSYSNYEWAGRRILSFQGTYRLVGDSLVFRITSSTEIIGGTIDWDGPPNDLGWIVTNGKVKKITQSQQKDITLSYEFISDDNHTYLVIEGRKFLLLNEDENAKIQW